MEATEELYDIKTTEELYDNIEEDNIQENNQNDFNIEQFENSMTLYYYKRDGAIYSWCTGINDMRTFGNYSEDYALILDYIVLPIDRYVIDNIKYFSIDKETKELCFNQPVARYKMR